MPIETDVLHNLQFSTASNDEPYMKYYKPKKGDIIIDAGAHVGIYTRRFSKLVGSSGKVYAIEPDYRALGLLFLNTEDCFDNIKILPYALWNEDRIIQFNIYSETIGMSSCVVSYKKGETYPVYAKKLDTIVEANLGIDLDTSLRRINFIKMDIEASEIRALDGMKKTLKITEALAIAAYHKINPKDPLYETIIEGQNEKTYPYVQDILDDAGFITRVETGDDGEIVYANRSDS